MNLTRRLLLAIAAALFSIIPALQALAQADWPARPIRLVSPYAAGGASDISLRIIAEGLGSRLNQTIVVENKPGASTVIANKSVAQSAPDGYTVLYAAAPYATAEALFGKLEYDRKDLRPVAMAVVAPLFLVVNAEAPYKDLKEFIAYGKSRTDGLKFGHPGAGTQPHLAIELLYRDAGIKGISVPFRGDAMAYTELLAGRIDATLTAISTALPLVESGKLRVLGTASAERSALYSLALTLREQGLQGVVAAGWYGFLVPAATPPAIADRLQTEITRVLADPAVRQKLAAQGLEVRAGTGVEFGKFIDDETRKWGAIIREANIKAE